MRQGLISFQNEIQCIQVTVEQAEGNQKSDASPSERKELCW